MEQSIAECEVGERVILERRKPRCNALTAAFGKKPVSPFRLQVGGEDRQEAAGAKMDFSD